MPGFLRVLTALAIVLATGAASPQASAKPHAITTNLWSLRPVVAPEVPPNAHNPIDAFLGESQRAAQIVPAERADPLTWLRRVTLDLTGLPPTLEEQRAYLADDSSEAETRVVDRLLASQQHGVRYARHWLDVLRYTDIDEHMPAAPGIHLWRDWVVSMINQDLPFDAFARAQILGNRAAQRRIISAAGHLTPVEPRPEDLFALGFLARGATSPTDADQQLAISAVETISSAFLAMTFGCAKCHDHFYDPIRQSDYYSLKAIFDPLALRPKTLATPDQIFSHGRDVEAHEQALQKAVDAMRRFIEPHHRRLFEERLSQLPTEAQAAIRKSERTRTAAEQKLYDDYYPTLRIDPPKLKAIMSPEEIQIYDEHLKRIDALKPPEALPVFWTVEEDALRATAKSYVLNTGDPARPKRNQEVRPQLPFSSEQPDFRAGRRETFVDWLTDPANPLFARVAVNRIWQWHFGIGLQQNPSDFGTLGGAPTHPKLLDFLAAEFVKHGYSMKWLHRLITTSDVYRRASHTSPELELANQKRDPRNDLLWKFPLRRLEAEPIRDSMLAAAGTLDLTLGGKSFDATQETNPPPRRTLYMSRGYRSFMNVMPDYLQTFDAEDGRISCPRRAQTVTAPQSLYLMNHASVRHAARLFAQRLQSSVGPDPAAQIELAYRLALGRPASPRERQATVDYLDHQPDRLQGFTWMLLNLDEFMYVR